MRQEGQHKPRRSPLIPARFIRRYAKFAAFGVLALACAHGAAGAVTVPGTMTWTFWCAFAALAFAVTVVEG